MAQTRKYRCRYPVMRGRQSCGAEDGLTRHCYDIVPFDDPGTPGECNDDADGEDPDWMPDSATVEQRLRDAVEVSMQTGLPSRVWLTREELLKRYK